jgi:amidase
MMNIGRSKEVFSKEATQFRAQHDEFMPTIATLCGQPATAFPVGLTHAGLPIRLQAIGPYLEDHTPIRFTTIVTRDFGGFRRPPGYDAM